MSKDEIGFEEIFRSLSLEDQVTITNSVTETEPVVDNMEIYSSAPTTPAFPRPASTYNMVKTGSSDLLLPPRRHSHTRMSVI